MTTLARESLWRRLSEAGLVTGDLPPTSAPTAPWYVRTMLGIAGWIGAMFLLGFVGAGLAFVFRTGAASLGVGALCCGLAFVIFRGASRNDLATQFALAVSIAGQSMFIYGLHEFVGFDSDSAAFFINVALFEAALTVLIPNFVHRVLTATAAAVTLWIFMYKLGLYGVPSGVMSAALAVLWLNEAKWAPRGALWRPIGYGLTFALLLVPNITGVLASTQPPLFPLMLIPWIHAILAGSVLVYVAHQLLTRYGTELSSTSGIATFVAAVAVSAASFRAGGVATALTILLLGFARGNRPLTGLGIVSMLGYLSYFYYSLQATLLTKSFVLIGTGVTLVIMWAMMRALFGTTEKEPANA